MVDTESKKGERERVREILIKSKRRNNGLSLKKTKVRKFWLLFFLACYRDIL